MDIIALDAAITYHLLKIIIPKGSGKAKLVKGQYWVELILFFLTGNGRLFLSDGARTESHSMMHSLHA